MTDILEVLISSVRATNALVAFLSIWSVLTWVAQLGMIFLKAPGPFWSRLGVMGLLVCSILSAAVSLVVVFLSHVRVV